MWLVALPDLGFDLPKWVAWIDWALSRGWKWVVYFDQDDQRIDSSCKRTWNLVELIMSSNNEWEVIAFKCSSKSPFWLCLNARWPVDWKWKKLECIVNI